MILFLLPIFILILISITVWLFRTAQRFISKEPGASFLCVLSGVWGVIVSILLIFILLDEITLAKYGYDVYTLKLYYVGGSEETTTYKMKGTSTPRIDTSYGKFNLTGGERTIPGVVRFEVLSVKNVKE